MIKMRLDLLSTMMMATVSIVEDAVTMVAEAEAVADAVVEDVTAIAMVVVVNAVVAADRFTATKLVFWTRPLTTAQASRPMKVILMRPAEGTMEIMHSFS
jgi:hypothetical protein